MTNTTKNNNYNVKATGGNNYTATSEDGEVIELSLDGNTIISDELYTYAESQGLDLDNLYCGTVFCPAVWGEYDQSDNYDAELAIVKYAVECNNIGKEHIDEWVRDEQEATQ